MKITDKHVSDYMLNIMIAFAEQGVLDNITSSMFDLLAFLELKQRRAEDRQREHDNGK